MGFKQIIEKIDINDERRQDEFNKIFNEIKDKELPTRRKNHIIWGSAKDRRFYISNRKPGNPQSHPAFTYRKI